ASAYEMLCRRYEGGNLHINRCRLHEKEEELWACFEFVPGETLSELMDKCLEKDDLDGFHALFREYVERIGYHQGYPVSDFDMVFSNIIVDGDKWTVIDYEWTFGKEMEIRELAFRAVLCYLLENEKRGRLKLERITEELGISEEEERLYREREREFQKFVTGEHKVMTDICELMRHRAVKPAVFISDRVQVYEDRGEGFSEEHSYLAMELYPGEQEVKLDFEVKGDVQVFRLDPSMDPCIVRIDELVFNGKEIPLGNKKIVYTNGRMLKSSPSFLFAAADPNICIRVADLDMGEENKLTIRMRIIRLPQDIAEDMAGAVKKFFEKGHGY
ncbi:MAG: hypothetical protein HDR26_00820, partial [Lachnospiraceae bacterium]|nr:hypothetical protein [Lachnospiraceae bacterium]